MKRPERWSWFLAAASALTSSACWLPPDDRDLHRCTAAGREELATSGDEGGSTEPRIVLGPTDETISTSGLSVQGRGEAFVGDVDLYHGVGTIDLGCRSVSLVRTGYWDGTDFKGIGALAVDGDRWYPLVFHCTDDGSLEWVEYESTDGTPATYEYASGRCEINAEIEDRRRLQLPRVDMEVRHRLVGYRINGPEIYLGLDGQGSMILGGVDYTLLAFNADVCEECDPPRHEIHAVLWDALRQSAAYADLALKQGSDLVELRAPFSLPGYYEIADWGQELQATFTTP